MTMTIILKRIIRRFKQTHKQKIIIIAHLFAMNFSDAVDSLSTLTLKETQCERKSIEPNEKHWILTRQSLCIRVERQRRSEANHATQRPMSQRNTSLDSFDLFLFLCRSCLSYLLDDRYDYLLQCYQLKRECIPMHRRLFLSLNVSIRLATFWIFTEHFWISFWK